MTYHSVVPASLETALIAAIERVKRDYALGRIPGFAVGDNEGQITVTIRPVEDEG